LFFGFIGIVDLVPNCSSGNCPSHAISPDCPNELLTINIKPQKLLTNFENMMSVAPKSTVAVTITSDLVCPWCWVGLRKLQQASEEAKVDVDITWKPFMLRPNTPQEGQPKGGTPASRVPAGLKAAGNTVGIDFSGLTDRTPNTIDFHATMKFLLDKEIDQTPFQEAVFDAYFTKGNFPDRPAMLKCAELVGIAEQVKTLYGEQSIMEMHRNEVTAEAEEASLRGVRGVPSFSFGDDTRPAFSGAQDVDTFIAYLKQNTSTKRVEQTS
jgi:predicted DsbA family dithiol-disulfide isomerase